MRAKELCEIGANYVAELGNIAPKAERITDKMPANFRFAGIIHLALPKARIIHVRRDPVDTCLSCFSKLFAARLPYSCDLGRLGRFYRYYEVLMEHWQRVLPTGVMLDLRYEDIIADLDREARKIVAHCGLDWDNRCLSFYETHRPIRTSSALEVRQPIYRSSIGSWRAYEAWLGPLIEALGTNGGGLHLATNLEARVKG
jgi:hypothetical protein